jgi:hypothetical protein
MPAPKMTDEQRAAALARAGEARRVRAEIKQLLKTGTLTIEEVFARSDEDDLVAGIKVGSVVVSMPHMGKIKAIRLLEDLEIDGGKRLRALGPRQREKLLASFQ